MNKYRVTIREILEREIIVNAENTRSAVDKASCIMRDGDIVLDADDFSHREYEAVEEIGVTHELMCLQCGRVFIAADDISTDELGPHTTCPYCKGSFDVDEEQLESGEIGKPTW